jgi:hypothetical protein
MGTPFEGCKCQVKAPNFWVWVLQMFAFFSVDQRPMCLPYKAPLKNVFRAITDMTIINSTYFFYLKECPSP